MVEYDEKLMGRIRLVLSDVEFKHFIKGLIYVCLDCNFDENLDKVVDYIELYKSIEDNDWDKDCLCFDLQGFDVKLEELKSDFEEFKNEQL